MGAASFAQTRPELPLFRDPYEIVARSELDIAFVL